MIHNRCPVRQKGDPSPYTEEAGVPRILVVDDEPDMCWALKRILRPAGYAVSTTTSGLEAGELVTKQRYAAAFVDGLHVAAPTPLSY